MAKKKKFEITGDELVCPKCGNTDFPEIKNYDITKGKKRKLGIFWFEYICKDCGVRIIHYINL